MARQERVVGKVGADAAKPRAKAAARQSESFAPGASPHYDEAVATEVARNAFSRERYELILKVITVLLAIQFVLVAANIYLGTRETRFRYFAVDPEGGIREIVALERPIQSVNEVLNWASQSVTGAFTLNFANYQTQLAESRYNFTDLGWQSFQDALRRNGVLDSIIKNMFVTTAVPTGAPVVVSSGLMEDRRYAWRLQVPILVTYESASTRTSQNLTVEMVVVRRPESENPRGLGIAQVIAR